MSSADTSCIDSRLIPDGARACPSRFKEGSWYLWPNLGGKGAALSADTGAIGFSSQRSVSPR